MKKPTGKASGGQHSNKAAQGTVAQDQTKPSSKALPQIDPPNLDAVPAELEREPIWLLWRYVKKKVGDKPTKVPYEIDRKTWAKWQDPSVLTTLDEARASLTKGKGWGIGFVFRGDNDLVGVDIDKARDPDTGALSDEARDIISTLNSYTEVSPSGTGVHILVRGSLPASSANKHGGFEVYEKDRFFTFTGQRIEGTPSAISQNQLGIETFCRKYMSKPKIEQASSSPNGAIVLHEDSVVMAAMFRSENRAEIRALWEGDTSAYGDDNSDADLALTNHLGFFTNYNREQMDRLFRQSKLMRAKWDEQRGGSTYGEMTLDKVFSDKSPGDGYQGRAHDKRRYQTALSPGERQHQQPARGSTPAPADLALTDFPQDDLGYAHSIAHCHYPMIRKHAGLGLLTYDDKEHRHVTGEAATARAHELAVLTARSIATTSHQINDASEEKRWEAYARSLRSRAKREAALELLLQTPARANDEDIDAHDLIVNTPTGVLDLRTLDVTPHDAEDIFTAVTRASYKPGVTHWAWDAVLALLAEDGRTEYVQRALGQAITGRTNRELFVFEGPKATGKTTLGEGLMTALGTDYAAAVDPGTLLEAGRGRNPGGPRGDLVALRAARLALTSEPNARARLDGQTVKRMTGSDSITARAVHGRTPVTFRPRFTIIMLANEVPAADWTDDALLSRLKLVPFRARPPRIDPRVRAALVDDPEQDALDALFTWVVEGAHAWIQDDFSMGAEPKVVQEATRRYRSDNDPFALWAEDRLRFDQADAIISVSDLHSDYVAWAGVNGITDPQRIESLGKWLRAQIEAGVNIERKRGKSGVSWQGVRLVGPTG